jgi:hypothetical protein
VAQGFGTLNDAVDGDTTSTGERNDLNTVYRLERDGIYLLNGAIENNFPLTVVAADGEGARPRLIPGVPTGGSSDRPFRPRSDITLRGLYLTNLDELGGRNTRIIRLSADSIRVVIDDCHLDQDNQSGFRIDGDWMRIYITNSIVSNIGLTLDPNNGRGIDDRGNPIDTLVIENSTWYNLSSTLLRDGGGGIINYVDINHNTFVNVGQQGLELGEVGEALVTNNLFIDPIYLGLGPGDERAEGFTLVVYGDSTGATGTLNVRNNNFYRDPALEAARNDSVGTPALYNSVADSLIELSNTGSTNISESVTFTNGPASPLAVVTQYYTDQTTTPAHDISNEPFDFAYASTHASFTASTGGQPLGALTWHGMTINASDRTSSLGGDGGTLPSDPVEAADFTGDGIVNFEDFLEFVALFGTVEGDGEYDARFDLTSDGKIDFEDFLTFVASFGESVG